MSAHDSFWLARYAYNTLQPVIDRETTKVILHLNFDYPEGVDIWVHLKADSSVITYKSNASKADIDRIARILEAASLLTRVPEPVAL